jgi:hypothetical protein
MSSTPNAEGKAALGADLVIPLLALGFAAYFFVSIRDLAWEAKANGMIIGTILVVLIAVQLVRITLAIVRGQGDLGTEPLWQPRDVLSKRIGMVLVTIAFIASIRWLGLTLALLLGMLVSLWLMGVRKPKVLVLISVIVAAAAYLLFIAALDSAFPHGPIEDLVEALRK